MDYYISWWYLCLMTRSHCCLCLNLTVCVVDSQFSLYCDNVAVASSASRMQETRFQIYLAQQHIEDINYNRFVETAWLQSFPLWTQLIRRTLPFACVWFYQAANGIKHLQLVACQPPIVGYWAVDVQLRLYHLLQKIFRLILLLTTYFEAAKHSLNLAQKHERYLTII